MLTNWNERMLQFVNTLIERDFRQLNFHFRNNNPFIICVLIICYCEWRVHGQTRSVSITFISNPFHSYVGKWCAVALVRFLFLVSFSVFLPLFAQFFQFPESWTARTHNIINNHQLCCEWVHFIRSLSLSLTQSLSYWMRY